MAWFIKLNPPDTYPTIVYREYLPVAGLLHRLYFNSLAYETRYKNHDRLSWSIASDRTRRKCKLRSSVEQSSHLEWSERATDNRGQESPSRLKVRNGRGQT